MGVQWEAAVRSAVAAQGVVEGVEADLLAVVPLAMVMQVAWSCFRTFSARSIRKR